MSDSWRDVARPIIARTLRENVGKTVPELRAALRQAYPFGPRQYWPYKVWCDEVRRQMNLTPTNQSELALYEKAMRGE